MNASDGISQAFVPLVIRGAVRYPAAYEAESVDGWAVYCLEGQHVVPKNVTVHPAAIEEYGKPVQLGTTIDDAYDNLLAAVLLPQTAAAAAEALSDHCKRYPANLLFCKAHGLPVNHLTPEQYIQRPGQVLPQTRCEPAEALKVSDVEQMLTTFMAIEDVATRTAKWRNPAPRHEVENALRWPLLSQEARESLGRQTDKTGKLPVVASRWLVKETVDELHRQTLTDFGYYWIPQYGFRLVCMTRTDLGIYAAAFVSRILQAVTVGARPLLHFCASCGDAFQPRSRSQQYCSKPECQRLHATRNKRRERERARAAEPNQNREGLS